MKKFLSIVLAVVMVLSMAVTAFAANVELWGENAEKSVQASVLSAMYGAGILKGDGDKAPTSNATLTRWQVALIALRVYTMLDCDGLENIDLDDENWANYVVDYGDVDVKYEDCEYPSALGAILFVQEKGFILGYEEDGKTYFKPAQQVTYAEAITIMVRILGWDSKAMNVNWPYNYVAQAAKLGLTTGITKIAMDDAVTYGVFAQLIYNALNAKRYIAGAKIESEQGFEIPAVGADNALNELATGTLVFAWIDDEGDVNQIKVSGQYDAFSFVKNAGKFAQIIECPEGKSGYEFDLGYFSQKDEEGYAVKNYNGKVYLAGENIMGSSSDYRVRNWFWSFYTFEFGDEGEIVLDYSTRTVALTHNQTRNKNYSANAWFMQSCPGKNVAMVIEPMELGEDLYVINVNGDIYLEHLAADVMDAYEEAYAEAYAEFIEEKLEAVVEDKAAMAVIKVAAMAYYRQGAYYGGGNGFDSKDTYADPDASLTGAAMNEHINGWSLNAVLDLLGISEMALDREENLYLVEELAKYDFDTESGPWVDGWEEEGLDSWVQNGGFTTEKLKNLYSLSHDWGKAFYEDLVAGEEDLLSWTAEKYVKANFGAEAEAAATKAANKLAIVKDAAEYLLGSIDTDVEGLDFLGWSEFVQQEDAKMKFTEDGDEETEYVRTFAINALYEEDYTKVEWVGEEKALGSYVVKTQVKNGFKTVTEFNRDLVELADLDATTFNAVVEFIGVCNEATYGAWLIDTNGDNLYDVCVYANFVTGIAD